jgi:hypothetical protein
MRDNEIGTDGRKSTSMNYWMDVLPARSNKSEALYCVVSGARCISAHRYFAGEAGKYQSGSDG